MTGQLNFQWKHISEKINSLNESIKFLFQTFQCNDADPYNAMGNLTPNIETISKNIKSFKSQNDLFLSADIKEKIDGFIQIYDKRFKNVSRDTEQLKAFLKITFVIFNNLQSEVSFLLRENQLQIRRSVEVAFAHLQRQLVADENVVRLWSSKRLETDFEKLGGAHFLLHKIWAFKVNAEGERTDLVLSEAINSESILLKSVDGLVLTEWKIVKSQQELGAKITEAMSQAKKYTQGSLYSIELSQIRYLVMVSEDHIDIPNQTIDNESIQYRVVNIAYKPSTPSVLSRKNL